MDIEKINKRYTFLKYTFFVPFVLMLAFYLLAFEFSSGKDDPLRDLAVSLYMAAMGVGLLFFVALGMLAKALGKNWFLWPLLSFLFPLMGGVIAFVMIRTDVKKVRVTVVAGELA